MGPEKKWLPVTAARHIPKALLICFSEDTMLSQATSVGAPNCLSFQESVSSATIHLAFAKDKLSN